MLLKNNKFTVIQNNTLLNQTQNNKYIHIIDIETNVIIKHTNYNSYTYV